MHDKKDGISSGCALREFEIEKMYAVRMERNELLKHINGFTVEEK